MSQVAANITTGLDARSGTERHKGAVSKAGAAVEFAKLVKEAGADARKTDPEASATRAEATVDEVLSDGENRLAETGQKDRPAQSAEHAGTGRDHPEIDVRHPAGRAADITTDMPADNAKKQGKASQPAIDVAAAGPDQTKEPVSEADTAQAVVAGSTPIVAVMAVAPYLTARTAPADANAGPAISQRSAIKVDRIATAETISVSAGKSDVAPSKAEKLEIAFGAGKSLENSGVQTASAQQVAGKSGPAPVVEGPAIPVAAGATPPAGAEARPPQPVVVPLDLGRALAGEGDLPASMREAVSSHVARVMAAPVLAGQPVSVLRIQLQPAHLGQINVTMRMSGEQMTVTLTPDSASAARALGSDQETIATVLRAVGGSFAGANIEVAGEGQLRTAADDASRGAEGRQGDRSGEGGHHPSSGGQAQPGGDGIDTARAGIHTGVQASSGEGRIII